MVKSLKIYKSFFTQPQHKNSIILVGNFDGIHLGHQKLFSLAKKYKKKYSLKIGVLTFEPMPKMFFNPKLKNFRLSNLNQKIENLGKFNVDFVENATLVSKDIETNTNYTAFAFKRAMNSHTNYLWTAAFNQNNDKIFIDIQFPNGILTIKVGKKRLFSSTSLLFIGWTIGSSLILFLIALFFIQGQVKPILRLAVAARQLGLGRDITNSFH